MRVTVDGMRLAQDWDIGAVSSGLKPSVKVPLSPRVIWNGNPFCEPGCVLYLPGYPGSGSSIKDFSGSGNHGTISGATWVRLPSGLWCLSFDGVDDYVNLGNPISLQITGKEIAVELWGKPITMIGGDAWRTVFMKGDYTFLGLRIYRDLSGLTFCIRSGDTSYTAVYPTALTSGQWYHIAGVYNGANVKIYVNGAETVGGALTGNIDSIAEDWCIGALSNLGRWCNITVDGACIYNRAVSATKIAQHYQQERHLFGV